MHQQNNRMINRATVGELGLMAYERALAECLKSFLSELFYTNAGVVIGYIQANQDNNIHDLMASSAELSLRPGLLRYGQNAVIASDWGAPPVVTIDMELTHPEMTVYFRITFEEKGIGVSIEGIVWTHPLGSDSENFKRFGEVLADSRLPA